MRLTFSLVDFEKSRLPSIMCVGLIQSVEGLHRTEGLAPLEQGGILPADNLQT